LVLQTGALGPLDNSQVSFTGFRVLSVTNNIIDNIHFVSTEKLEAHQYRLPWDEAIRPEPRYPYARLRHFLLLQGVDPANGVRQVGSGSVKSLMGLV
jgi:hypothetical protein